jgi:hypothetical protein
MKNSVILFDFKNTIIDTMKNAVILFDFKNWVHK